jgi:hypothetical protein
MRPSSGANRRVISDIKVLLPAPFGPSKAVNRPAGTTKATLSNALAARV